MGKSDWSDETKFSSKGGEGIYLNDGNLRMKINADVVIGQEDFVSGDVNQGWSPDESTLNSPYGINLKNEKLIVADIYNHRVLIYNETPTKNNASADVVIGQLDFTSNEANQGGSASANTLNLPIHAFSDGTRLFVADGNNNRVLIYNEIPTENNATADVVIGQLDFTSTDVNQGNANPAANTLNYPFAVFSDGEKLFIAERNSYRLLIYNSIPTENNASADVVIGQPDFISADINQGGDPAANTAYHFSGVFYDGKNLFINDMGNNRVLVYNEIPTENNAPADIVIGQEDFNTSVIYTEEDISARTLYGAHLLSICKERIFLPLTSSRRLLILNATPTENNSPTDEVIGQPDFISSDAYATSKYTFGRPDWVSTEEEVLAVTDEANNRVLLFNKQQETSTLTSSTRRRRNLGRNRQRRLFCWERNISNIQSNSNL